MTVAFRHEPAFFSGLADDVADDRDTGAADEARRRAAGRFVSMASAFLADMQKPGGWSTVISDGDLNAWLAVDVPRSHPELLPTGAREMRVCFLPGRILVGYRLSGLFSAVVWAEIEPQLLEANRIGVSVLRCQLGLVPLPSGVAASRIANDLKKAGLSCEMLLAGGHTRIVVHVPTEKLESKNETATSRWLEGLRIEEGEAFVTGRTVSSVQDRTP